VAPGVIAVETDIERHIPHDADAQTVAVFPQLQPLLAQNILDEHLVADVIRIRRQIQSAVPDPFPRRPVPLIPAHQMMRLLEGQEHRVRIDPVLFAEAVEFPAAAKLLVGLAQIVLFVGADLVIFDAVLIFMELLRRINHAFLGKQIQADVEFIHRMGGIRLIRRISEAQRIQRQNLPDGKSAAVDQLGKLIAFRSEITDAIVTGQ